MVLQESNVPINTVEPTYTNLMVVHIAFVVSEVCSEWTSNFTARNTMCGKTLTYFLKSLHSMSASSKEAVSLHSRSSSEWPYACFLSKHYSRIEVKNAPQMPLKGVPPATGVGCLL